MYIYSQCQGIGEDSPGFPARLVELAKLKGTETSVFKGEIDIWRAMTSANVQTGDFIYGGQRRF